MDVFSRSPSSSSFRSSSSGRRSRERRCTVSAVVGRVACAIVTCLFATVGSLVGAITGALIGLATESGLIRGAGIGAISGAVFSIEAVESSLDLWYSRQSGILSVLYLVDIICSLLSGRIVREKVDPAVQSAVRSQMNAVIVPFIETSDFFATDNITGGLSIDSVAKLPKIVISAADLEAAGDRFCCSVCLQDFQIGETVRRLPHCHHLFHLSCIDSWLVRHGSCPLCRRDI
ncbi:NEP1-interacting protein 2-like [Canna indica]|uniref:NEP1-interacting protein 2-like n=1 Tax=Canna indica TaxID=4628 RepID=A0AAQ3KJ80_9LILI|nr:NEP1-interacting protein 2-like [Canna indica]